MENKEFKDELRVDNRDLILKDNKVSSPIIPQNSQQLKRSIIFEGNVEVLGAVYGEKILIHNGPVSLLRAAFAKSEFVVDQTAKGKIVFHESVGSGGVVSCIATNDKALFGADINAKRVSLCNCFVGGCIFADEIYIENCVVIGGVFATKKLNIVHSIVGTFNSQEVSLGGKCYLLYPSAFAVEPLNAVTGGELWNLSLADLMDLFKGDPMRSGTGLIPIDIRSEALRTNLKSDDGTIYLVHSYSVAGKVMVADIQDFEKLNNHFLINAGALSSQLLKEYETVNAEGVSKKLSLDNIASFFFDLLDGKYEIPVIDSTIDFSSLKDSFSD